MTEWKGCLTVHRGILHLKVRDGGRWVERSLRLEDTPANRKTAERRLKQVRDQLLGRAAALGRDPALPEVTWYEATRHTGASAWVTAGGDMTRLAVLLGHSSTEVTRRYTHLRPDAWTAEDRARLAIGSRIGSPRRSTGGRKPRKRKS
jgi:integrase